MIVLRLLEIWCVGLIASMYLGQVWSMLKLGCTKTWFGQFYRNQPWYWVFLILRTALGMLMLAAFVIGVVLLLRGELT